MKHLRSRLAGALVGVGLILASLGLVTAPASAAPNTLVRQWCNNTGIWYLTWNADSANLTGNVLLYDNNQVYIGTATGWAGGPGARSAFAPWTFKDPGTALSFGRFQYSDGSLSQLMYFTPGAMLGSCANPWGFGADVPACFSFNTQFFYVYHQTSQQGGGAYALRKRTTSNERDWVFFTGGPGSPGAPGTTVMQWGGGAAPLLFRWANQSHQVTPVISQELCPLL